MKQQITEMRQYVSAKTIAKNLEKSEATVWRWVAKGILPQPIRPTQRTTRFDAEAVQTALDKMQS